MEIEPLTPPQIPKLQPCQEIAGRVLSGMIRPTISLKAFFSGRLGAGKRMQKIATIHTTEIWDIWFGIDKDD